MYNNITNKNTLFYINKTVLLNLIYNIEPYFIIHHINAFVNYGL